VGIGRIGKVLNHAIKYLIEIVAETYKGFNQKGILYNSSGDDSPPVKDDKVFLVKADGTGKYIIVGVLTQSQGAKPGEKILFARDESGKIKSKLSMLGEGSIKWEADGDFKLDGKKNIELTAAQKATVKGEDVELNGQVKSTGGSFECSGIVSPTGNGALCGCQYCYVTAAPVAGNKAMGT
jgi:selenophosphate synthetase-related protein